MNADNNIQTAFIFLHNLQTNLNPCPTIPQVPENLRRKILVVLSEPRAHCSLNRVIVKKASPPFPQRWCFRELPDVIVNFHRTWAAFLCGYRLLPYLLPTKTAQHHAVLSWYTYSGSPPSCNGYSVFTVIAYRSLHVTIKLDSAAI